MKILLLNTHQSAGGAAIAARRLAKSLHQAGHEPTLLVLRSATPDPLVQSLALTWRYWWNFLWERLLLFVALGFRRRRLFELNLANTGCKVTRHPAFLDADVIHLHWTCQALLSVAEIAAILRSGKPVVWTLHDLWPLRAIDPYRDDYLCLLSDAEAAAIRQRAAGEIDEPHAESIALRYLAHRCWQQKLHAYAQGTIRFVACSHYLARKARLSPLSQGHEVSVIPNPIDTLRFRKLPQDDARQQLHLPIEPRVRLLLFAAFRLTNLNKGYDLLAEALRQYVAAHPQARHNTALLVMGGDGDALRRHIDLPIYDLGYVSDVQKAVWAYSAADVFVLPSRSENLPNTIMEAMACELPVISYGVGGVPEMVEHRRTGYVAQPLSASDLAHGLHHLLDEADRDAMGFAARQKVEQCYAESAVAAAYAKLYESACATADRHIS